MNTNKPTDPQQQLEGIRFAFLNLVTTMVFSVVVILYLAYILHHVAGVYHLPFEYLFTYRAYVGLLFMLQVIIGSKKKIKRNPDKDSYLRVSDMFIILIFLTLSWGVAITIAYLL